MSGEHAKAHVGVASATATAPGPTATRTTPADRPDSDAVALRLDELPAALRVKPSGVPSVERDSPIVMLGTGLTRDEILTAKQQWQSDGPKSRAIHSRLGVSKSTLIRHRHRHGLVPWPEN